MTKNFCHSATQRKYEESRSELVDVRTKLTIKEHQVERLTGDIDLLHHQKRHLQERLDEALGDLDIAQSERDQFCEKLTESEYKRNKLQEDLDFMNSTYNP